MPMDLDTFLVALYTIVDDWYQQHMAGAKPVRPGPRPVVSDSEVLTLALCGQWGGRSERAFYAMCGHTGGGISRASSARVRITGGVGTWRGCWWP